MNESELRMVLRDLAGQKMPAERIDLWPAVQSRVQMSDAKQAKGKLMNTQFRFKPVYVLASIVLIGALVMAFPQGRAWAQQALSFFTRGESNAMPGVTSEPAVWIEQTPGVANPTSTPKPTPPVTEEDVFDVCGSKQTPRCSIDEIRALVDFPVYAFPELPAGMQFVGATGNAGLAHLFYQAPDQSGWLVIYERPVTGEANPPAGEVGADAKILTVQVGRAQAEYVKGSYDGNQSPPVWNSELGLQQLRWVNDGIGFTLMMHATRLGLDATDLAALAATLTDGPLTGEAAAVAPTPTATPVGEKVESNQFYPLTLEQAAEQAGFTPLTLSILPEPLVFVGAKYDTETRILSFLYNYTFPNRPDLAEYANGLVIYEQIAPEGEDCDLCGFVQGNGFQVEDYPSGKLVSETAEVETVPINGAEGLYAEGIGWVSRTEETGWQWDDEPYIKRLRYREGDLAIQVIAFTYELSKEDLIRIAESLK